MEIDEKNVKELREDFINDSDRSEECFDALVQMMRNKGTNIHDLMLLNHIKECVSCKFIFNLVASIPTEKLNDTLKNFREDIEDELEWEEEEIKKQEDKKIIKFDENLKGD